jgi:putative membrane protein
MERDDEDLDEIFPDKTSKNPKDRREEIRAYLAKLFDFHTDKEDDFETLEMVRADVDFRGTKLWILICAIFVASLGLNTNSTAVIIGAMLISPLMGPIIGFGTALGIYDFELLKRSLRNLGLTTLFSVLTATIYFILTPITDSGSELLGRTQPNIYDVLIAFFGGAAGMIAASTKSKGQVLPGVAIATALMPPLCTAGYGIATGQWHFFFGAFYLFLINSVFIALATYLVVRLLRFPPKVFLDRARGRKVHRILMVIATCTIIPAVYLSIGMVRDSIATRNAKSFVENELALTSTQVVKYTLGTQNGVKVLDVVLLGVPLQNSQIDSLQNRLKEYGLAGTQLLVHQGFEDKTDLGELRNTVLKDLYENSDAIIQRQRQEIDSLKQIIAKRDYYDELEGAVVEEMKSLFPSVEKAFLVAPSQSKTATDSTLNVVIRPRTGGALSVAERQKMIVWLSARTKAKAVDLIIDSPKK